MKTHHAFTPILMGVVKEIDQGKEFYQTNENDERKFNSFNQNVLESKFQSECFYLIMHACLCLGQKGQLD